MHLDFYHSKEYQDRQSLLTKESWRKGVFDFMYKKEWRVCRRLGCGKSFEATSSNPKIYCNSSCAAMVNNKKRGPKTEEVKRKIANSLRGRVYPMRVKRLIEKHCENQKCTKTFSVWPYLQTRRKFCSNQCAMDVIGGRPTSPRASRGKAGVRKDISPTTYFYSRWEANMARLYTYLGIRWIYAPTSFNIGDQMYTPDFFLPESDKYVEVKNFWWKYSKERDEKFRKLYPNIKLEVVSKIEYTMLEKQYAKLIPTWEYKNSVFPLVF